MALELTDDPAPAGHRERLLLGLAASIRARGFRQTTVADVVREARTSKRTFYEHFDDREGCLLALADLLDDQLSKDIAAAVDPDAGAREQVRQAVTAYLDAVSGEPALVSGVYREVLALGEPGRAKEREGLEHFAQLLIDLAGRVPGAPPVSPDVARMLVGGLRDIVLLAVEQDRDPRELHDAATTVIGAVLTRRG